MNMCKRLIAILSASVLIGLGAYTVTRSQQKGATPEKDEATVVKVGVMTAQQRLHSRLYQSYKGLEKPIRELIREALAKGQNDGIFIFTSLGDPIFRPDANSGEFNVLERLVCGADAIIIGTVKSRSSQLTEDELYVFTDYELTVEQVLKDNPFTQVAPSSVIIVSRPGGKVMIDGYTVSAVDESLKPLSKGGRYPLFLKYIPATGAYIASDSQESFELKDERVIALTDGSGYAKGQQNKQPDALIGEVRSAVPSGCK